MWLKIKEGETIIATIDFTSIKSVTKHWTGQRSELCLGKGCPHCLSGVPKRWRYQARLIVDGAPANWEFGERVMTQLNDIPHDTNFAHVSITRIGDSRNTDYQVSQSEAKPADEERITAPILKGEDIQHNYGRWKNANFT